jgi:hypothetical protein
LQIPILSCKNAAVDGSIADRLAATSSGQLADRLFAAAANHWEREERWPSYAEPLG